MKLKELRFKLSATPGLNSYEGQTGNLTWSYATGVDCRFRCVQLGPLMTTVDLTSSQGSSVTNSRAMAFSEGVTSDVTECLLIGNGTKVSYIRLSNRTMASDGGASDFSSAVTHLITTRSANGTQEVSVCLASNIYQVITALVTGEYTVSANNESIINRFHIKGPSYEADGQIFGLGQASSIENKLRHNVLTGTVTMDASAWATRATIGDTNFTFTGGVLDGNFVIVGTTAGPYRFNNDHQVFVAMLPSLTPSANNCFPGETEVDLSAVVRAVSRRWYEGDMINVVTAAGRNLTGTPNHPVLTERGWVGMGFLNEGDYVFSDQLSERASGVNPDENNRVARLDEVFGLAEILVAAERRTGGADQFHGDGSDHEVDVVTLEGDLWNRVKALLFKYRLENALATANLEGGIPATTCDVMPPHRTHRTHVTDALTGGFGVSPAFFGSELLGAADSGFVRSSHGNVQVAERPTNRHVADAVLSRERSNSGSALVRSDEGVSVGREPGAFFSTGSSGVPAQLPREGEAFLLGSNGDSLLSEDGLNFHSREAVLPAEGMDGHSANVVRDEIVSVERKHGFSGHVYNLETDVGNYLANSITVSNCKNMAFWEKMGTVIPLERETRLSIGLDGYSIGPEMYPFNTSPVQGRVTAQAYNEQWGWWAVYNPFADATYLCAVKPPKGYGQPAEIYPITKLADGVECEAIEYAGTKGGVTSPTWYIGHDDDAQWFIEGRNKDHNLDTACTFAASGSLFTTQVMRDPDEDKTPKAIRLKTSGCTATETITITQHYTDKFGVAQSTILTVINSNGTHILDIPREKQMAADSFYFEIALARGGTTTATPRILPMGDCDLVVMYESSSVKDMNGRMLSAVAA